MIHDNKYCAICGGLRYICVETVSEAGGSVLIWICIDCYRKYGPAL